MAKGEIPGGLTLGIDVSAMQTWLTAWKLYPFVAGKWLSTTGSVVRTRAGELRRSS